MDAFKLALYFAGIDAATTFLERNDITVPEFVNLDEPTRNNQRLLHFIGTCGFYRRSVVHVSVARCASPAKAPMSRMWSYPRHKIDRTPIGVVAHEVGHHVDTMLGYPSRSIPKDLWRRPVSGYEPNASELFAESMRLFILNPHLLKSGSPLRYEFLRGLGLQPATRQKWDTKLKKAPERVVTAARNWINQVGK